MEYFIFLNMDYRKKIDESIMKAGFKFKNSEN